MLQFVPPKHTADRFAGIGLHKLPQSMHLCIDVYHEYAWTASAQKVPIERAHLSFAQNVCGKRIAGFLQD